MSSEQESAATSGPAATLLTAASFSSDSYRLLELNAEVEQAIAAGSKLVLVGAPDERAVLCTPDKSYYLAKEDTSNLRLLTPHTDWTAPQQGKPASVIEVQGSALFHYVLQPKTPDLSQLRELLLQSPYDNPRGVKAEALVKRIKLDASLYSTEALVAALQTSEHEVLSLLLELHAFEDAGVWRVLRPSYQARVFGDMLDAVVQHDWPALAAPGVSIAQFVREVDEPLVAIRQCCLTYGAVSSDGPDAEERCVLDPVKVAVFRAKALFDERAAEAKLAQQHSQFQTQSLQAAAVVTGDGWPLDEFMDKWQLRVPDGVTVTLDMLRGVVLTKVGKPGSSRIVFFPEDALPMDPKARFEQLFAVQDKWTIAQLEPFIKSLVRPGVTQASLLLKFARSSRQANSSERLYSKR